MHSTRDIVFAATLGFLMPQILQLDVAPAFAASGLTAATDVVAYASVPDRSEDERSLG